MINLIFEQLKENQYMIKDELRNYFKVYFNPLKSQYVCQYQLTKKERMDKKYKRKKSNLKLSTFIIDKFDKTEIINTIQKQIIESKKPKNPYIRIKTYKVNNILSLIIDEDEYLFNNKKRIDNRKYILLNDYKIKINSTRLRTFKRQLECQHCKIQAKFFALETTHKNEPHLNLYGINKYGHEIMLTTDHIIPIAKKGNKYNIDNRQTLCQICNEKKRR